MLTLTFIVAHRLQVCAVQQLQERRHAPGSRQRHSHHVFAMPTGACVYVIISSLHIICAQCGASRTVAAIKAGFVARTTRRKG